MPEFQAIYINYSTINITRPANLTQFTDEDIFNLYPPQYYEDLVSQNTLTDIKNPQLFAKSYFGLKYFYYETNYRWVFRACDDTAINYNLLYNYTNELENKYDPLEEAVILGNCVFNEYGNYLQGGSGFLYSRKAVELMLPHFPEAIIKTNIGEDIFHNMFLERLNISLEKATSTHFIGHNFHNYDVARIMNNDFSNIPICQKIMTHKRENHCAPFHAPLNKVMFFHMLYHDPTNGEFLKIANSLFNANDTIHFTLVSTGICNPHLCRNI